MQVLRGIALGLLGFFLFIGLILLGIAFTIDNTALNPQFIINEIGKLDIPSMVHETLAKSVPADYQPYLKGIDASVTETLPWINQQVSNVINGTYDYLLGKTDRLDLSLSTQPLQQSLVKNLTSAFLQSAPADHSRLTDADKQVYLTRFQEEIVTSIPAQIRITPDSLGADGANTIIQARNIAGYLKTIYSVLIASALVMAFLLAWLLRDMKSILMSLGIICFISGVLSTIAVFGLKSLIPMLIPSNSLPELLRIWIQTAIEDFISPWGIYSLSFLIG